MRKDLRIGLGIGLVLLLVLVVYLLIPKGTTGSQANQQAGTEGTDGAVEPGEGEAPAGEEGTTPGESAPADTGAPADEPAPGGSPARSDVFAGESNPPGGTDAGGTNPPAQGNTRGTDWASLLNDPPSLSVTPPRGGLNNPGTSSARTGATSAVIPEVPGRQAPAAPRGSDEPAAVGGPTAGGSTPPAGGARQHRIQRGEHFTSIAKAYYGDAKYYRAIERANPNVDSARLQPGMTINLPDPAEVKRGTEGGGGSSDGPADRALGSNEYRVQQNDSLYKISMERYGSPKMTDAIYDLNREAIGPDSARLKLNMVLKMPPSSSDSGSGDSARQAAGRSGQ